MVAMDTVIPMAMATPTLDMVTMDERKDLLLRNLITEATDTMGMDTDIRDTDIIGDAKDIWKQIYKGHFM